LKTSAPALAALVLLAACSQHGQSGNAGQDKFAGFDQEILKWRQEILSNDPLCRSQAEGEKCESFEVVCKAERTLTPDDAAKGITARVVAAMTWSGFDAKFRHAQSGVRAAEFAKGRSGWTRTPHAPINMQTCGDL
jgi:hypothetical protein